MRRWLLWLGLSTCACGGTSRSTTPLIGPDAGPRDGATIQQDAGTPDSSIPPGNCAAAAATGMQCTASVPVLDLPTSAADLMADLEGTWALCDGWRLR